MDTEEITYNFEEIIQDYKLGKIIEYFHPFDKEWKTFSGGTFLNARTLFDLKFRHKKEKIKRYQVLFYILHKTDNRLKRFYKTTDLPYENEEDFYKRFSVSSGQNFIFDKLILESEEEFDK